jgi:hypothetical protein
MSRTSIITALYLAPSTIFNSIVYNDKGLPDEETLKELFTQIPIVLEKAELKQSLQDSDQGNLEDISIRANVHRDSLVHQLFTGKFLLAYLETSNEERHFVGTLEYPLSFSYSRDSGSSNSDTRETTLTMTLRLPL